MNFGNNEHQYVSKTCSKFHIKMRNVRVAVYQIAMPLNSKLQLIASVTTTFAAMHAVHLRLIKSTGFAITCLGMLFHSFIKVLALTVAGQNVNRRCNRRKLPS